MALGFRRRRPAVVGSAARLNLTDRYQVEELRRFDYSWRSRLWAAYGAVGEIRYGVDFRAHSLSRLTLVIAETDPEGSPRLLARDDAPPEAVAMLDDLGAGIEARGLDGHAAMLHDFGLHLDIPGESFLIGSQAGGANSWDVLSVDELVPVSGRWERIRYPGGPREPLDPETFVLRIWHPHPRWSAMATSPLLGILDRAEELMLYSDEVMASARSRLALSGLLPMPEELSFAPIEPGSKDPFTEELFEAASAAIRDPRSATAVIPIVIRGKAEYLDRIKPLQLSRPADEHGPARRKELIERIAAGFPLPAEKILGMRDLNHWPCDEQTEVLTERGWMRHEGLRPGEDRVLTLNPDGTSCWQGLADVRRFEVVDESFVSLRGENHDSLTSAEHRWPVVTQHGEQVWRTSSSIRTADRLVAGAPCADVPATPKWSDGFVEMVARFATIGNCVLRGAVGVLEVAPDRVVARSFVESLTRAQLELFLRAGISGEQNRIVQASPQRLAPFELAAILAGYGVTSEPVARRAVLRLYRSPHVAVRSLIRQDTFYTGTMFCPVVPGNRNFLARRNGTVYYTGNSAWLIDDASWAHIEPTAQLIANALTHGWLRPGLEALGVPDPRRWQVWFQPPPTSKDESEQARDAHDRLTISDETYRRKTGYSDEDAPSPEEYARRVGVKVGDAGIAITGNLAGSTGLGAPVPRQESPADDVSPGPPPQEQPAPGPPGMTAAGDPRLARLGSALAEIDRDLRSRLALAADAAIRSAVGRAGARLRSRLEGNRKRLALADLARSADNLHLAAHLGPAQIRALGLEEDDLLEGSLDDYDARAEGWIASAQQASLRRLAAALGVSLAVLLARLAPRLDAGRAAGVAHLSVALRERARQVLYSPDGEPPTPGEADDLLAPRGAIRAALAAAGGAPLGTGLALGLAAGVIAREVMAEHGVRVVGSVWRHGSPARPLEAHEALDGEEFDCPELWDCSDERLAILPGDDWLGRDFYSPGDHDGCTCDAAPVLEEVR